MNNFNRPITYKEIESAIKSHPTKKDPKANDFGTEFYQNFKEWIPIVKMFHIIEIEETLPNSFYEAAVTLIPKPHNVSTKKENYRPISLMNIHAKMLNKILTNWIQEWTKQKTKNHPPWLTCLNPRDAGMIQNTKIYQLNLLYT